MFFNVMHYINPRFNLLTLLSHKPSHLLLLTYYWFIV